MEPGGSMPHSQGLTNNFYPEPNQPDYKETIFLNYVLKTKDMQ